MSNEIVMPFGEHFATFWEYWKIYKKEEHKFKFKSTITEQMSLKKIVELSGGKEDIAIKIIEESIAQGWKGFFPLKNQTNGKQSTTDYKSRLAARING